MKILVIGDTHGKLGMVRDIWSKLTGVDLVIHTGDYYTDAKDLAEEFHIPFVYVRGNCDGSYSSSNCSPAGRISRLSKRNTAEYSLHTDTTNA